MSAVAKYRLLLLSPQLHLWGSPFWVRICAHFFFVDGACVSGSFRVPAMECMCTQTRPRFVLSSGRVLGEWSQNPCYLQGKNPLCRRNSPQRRRERRTLHQVGQRAQHTTNELFGAQSVANGVCFSQGKASHVARTPPSFPLASCSTATVPLRRPVCVSWCKHQCVKLPDHSGVSRLYNILEIYHSGPKASIMICCPGFEYPSSRIAERSSWFHIPLQQA